MYELHRRLVAGRAGLELALRARALLALLLGEPHRVGVVLEPLVVEHEAAVVVEELAAVLDPVGVRGAVAVVDVVRRRPLRGPAAPAAALPAPLLAALRAREVPVAARALRVRKGARAESARAESAHMQPLIFVVGMLHLGLGHGPAFSHAVRLPRRAASPRPSRATPARPHAHGACAAARHAKQKGAARTTRPRRRARDVGRARNGHQDWSLSSTNERESARACARGRRRRRARGTRPRRRRRCTGTPGGARRGTTGRRARPTA